MASNEIKKLLEEISSLKAINAELEIILESIYDEVYVTAADGTTLRVNSACKRFFDLEPSELIGKNVKDLNIHPILTPRVVKEKKTITKFQQNINNREAIVTSTPIFDENRNVVKVVSITRDVTEINQLKKQIQESEILIDNYKSQLLSMQTKNNHIIHNMICKSKKMKNIIDLATKASKYDSNILITGPSGVGKGVLAKFIHDISHREKGPFIHVNCGSIPENLLESEFFGYERGAFTGANKTGKIGLFELSNNGTIFLDEICELPLALQVKLLTVLQEKKVTRLGGNKEIKVDFRLVAAGNKPIKKLVQNGRFREDLYYRLNVVPIEIPSLAERQEDILPLIHHFLNQLDKRYHKKLSISSEAIDCFFNYAWPGNIRELENIIERLVVTIDEDEIKPYHLPPHMRINSNSFYGTFSQTQPICSLKDLVYKFERDIILSSYKEQKSTYKVAKLLDISQSAVVRRLKKYKLEMENFNSNEFIK
ncbi:sigma 54-interacting transcriptional regulator [Clostridiaceae bacterium 35-E11]